MTLTDQSVAEAAADEGGPSEATAGPILGEARPLRVDVWRRFRRNKLAMVGLGFIVLLALLAIFAPLVAPYGITERTSGAFRQGPSADHWFGTDGIGRDVFSRVIYGARVSLRIGILATLISLTIGLVLGAQSLPEAEQDDALRRAGALLDEYPAAALLDYEKQLHALAVQAQACSGLLRNSFEVKIEELRTRY